MIQVLLIEDNFEMAENTAEILELSNYQVTTAVNGKEGVRKALEDIPDIILCDIMMPEMDGYGVLYALSKNIATQHIPFIFLTAKADKPDLRKGMEMGADDYLTKPYNDLELLHAIETRLKKNQKPKQNEIQLPTEKDLEKGIKSLIEKHKIPKKTFNKKEYIFTEDALPYYIYYLQSGRVKVSYTKEINKEITTQLIGEKQFFGLDEVLNASPYSCSASALEESCVYLIEKDIFLNFLIKNKPQLMAINNVFINRIKDLENRLFESAYMSVRKRVANTLLWLHNHYQGITQFSLSREELANIVGISPESAIRTLSDFKNQKIIALNASTITLLDIEALQKVKN